ncbi:transmembrane protein 165 isoform X6 [Spodoptera frugiperda]|uniref:GDT1 family protein n=1 Tax=Spodoptera frugiperda TaxID=7108 RepID=A0A9R0DSV0_SPOFR|nr:transmembrane protein 165 isoform X6 [Spodoptera frugiperda]
MVKMLKKRSVCLALAVFLGTVAVSVAQGHAPVPPSPDPSPASTTPRAAIQGSFLQGFLASLSVVVVSELGDKTFFIAAIMAMKHPRIIVFAGAISALVFMTILSAAFGWIATVIPRVYTYYASAVLFAIFGIKMLRDGWKMDPNEGQEELEEVQSELKRREDQEAQKERSNSPDATSVVTSGTQSPRPPTPEVERGRVSPAEPVAGSSAQSEPLRVILRHYAWQKKKKRP